MAPKIFNKLFKWKENNNRRSLLIYGARQVGKTYTALTFGKQFYKNTVYINMEGSTEITAIFSRDLIPERIIRELSAKSGQLIFKRDTLLIFDEIQSCERALTPLKYFCEEAPEYHIIAAGNLLGVALNCEKYHFPVGKVDMTTLYPLDFEEFLWATDNMKMCELIKECYVDFSPNPLHDMGVDLYKNYLVGGMPRVIIEYVDTKEYNFVTALQKSLNESL